MIEVEQKEFEVKLTPENELILDRWDADWRDLIEGEENPKTLTLYISVEENFNSEIGSTDEYGRQERFLELNHTAYFDEQGNELENEMIDILKSPCGIIA